jgi:hypothetical protein
MPRLGYEKRTNARGRGQSDIGSMPVRNSAGHCGPILAMIVWTGQGGRVVNAFERDRGQAFVTEG